MCGYGGRMVHTAARGSLISCENNNYQTLSSPLPRFIPPLIIAPCSSHITCYLFSPVECTYLQSGTLRHHTIPNLKMQKLSCVYCSCKSSDPVGYGACFQKTSWHWCSPPSAQRQPRAHSKNNNNTKFYPLIAMPEVVESKNIITMCCNRSAGF